MSRRKPLKRTTTPGERCRAVREQWRNCRRKMDRARRLFVWLYRRELDVKRRIEHRNTMLQRCANRMVQAGLYTSGGGTHSNIRWSIVRILWRLVGAPNGYDGPYGWYRWMSDQRWGRGRGGMQAHELREVS